MKDIIRLGLILMVFTAVAAAVLALAYNYTEDIIEQQKKAEIKDKLLEVFPTADDFREIDENNYEAFIF